MTIATKSGGLIVKDGKLAENCGCCGGWYCSTNVCCVNNGSTVVGEMDTLLSTASGVSVTISSQDVLTQYTCNMGRAIFCPGEFSFGFTGYFPGDSLTGTFALTKQGPTLWAYSYPTSSTLCGSSITLTKISSRKMQLALLTQGRIRVDFGSPSPPSKNDITCASISPSSNEKTGQCETFILQGSCPSNVFWDIDCPSSGTLDIQQLTFTAKGGLKFPVYNTEPPDGQSCVFCGTGLVGSSGVASILPSQLTIS